MTEGCKVMTVLMDELRLEGTRRTANHSFTISRDWVCKPDRSVGMLTGLNGLMIA